MQPCKRSCFRAFLTSLTPIQSPPMSALTTNFTQLRAVMARWHGEHGSVAEAATTINLKHLRWLAPVGAAITVLHVLTFGLQIQSGAHQGVSLTWRLGLLVAHAVMGLVFIFFALAVRQLDPVRPNLWGRVLPVSAIALSLLFALVIASIDQLVTPNITPFLIGCLLLGVIFYVRPLPSAALYLGATLAYWFGIGLTQTNPEQLFSNRLNGATIGVLGWLLQLVIWRNFTTITLQQRRLEHANVQLTERQTDLEHLARKDALTGLANRFAANERLHTEFVSMKRFAQNYAVLMIDIDLFKRINDTHGHAVGDQVLQRVANTLQAALRESDFCARFGGEEFLAVLPATELPAAIKVAEKLRQAIEAAPDPVAGRMTLSIGLSQAAPDQANEDVAVRQADDALYRAKHGGRNRVHTAPEALERLK